jgi:RNA polymerase sigma-70 factor (ECF subfamily)
MEDQEKTLIRGLAKRDRRTFGLLYETYHAPLFRFAETYVCCPGLSEDIVQEVFVKLWENPHTRISKSLQAYLFLMVRNRCIDHLRSLQVEDKKRKKLMEAQILSDSVDLELDEEVSRKIKDAVEELPEQCQQVYRMSVYDGLKHAEIAEELDISLNAVKVQVFRAKKSLREKLYSLREFLVLFSSFYFLGKERS